MRAAASLFAVVLTVGLVGCGGSGSDPPVASGPDSGSAAVAARIQVGGSPLDVVADEDAIWVSVSDTDALVRVDPQTNQVVATTPIAHPLSLAVGFDSVWVTSSAGVTRVNATTAEIEVEIQVPFADDLADY